MIDDAVGWWKVEWERELIRYGKETTTRLVTREILVAADGKDRGKIRECCCKSV
jgi:hypothetical protein